MLSINRTQLVKWILPVIALMLPLVVAACGANAQAETLTPVGLRTEGAPAHADSGAVEAAGSAIAAVAELLPAPVVVELSAGSAIQTLPTAAQLTAADLTDAEIAGLIFMREEEKLARDVYLALYDLLGVQTFTNIAGSEQAHMDAVLSLLEGYGLDDPAAGNDPGVFTDPQFAALYEQLVAQGSLSLVDALTVGANIEELDIVDLGTRMAGTDQAAILQVYDHLLTGSKNHLRGFVNALQQQTGVAYQPIYLDQAALDAIMSAAPGRGAGNGGGNGNGGNGLGNGGGNGNGGNGLGNGGGSGRGNGNGFGRQGG
jgi:hypothetical protein